MTVGMIAAMNVDRIIGMDGKIPWRHAGDFRRFKRVTIGATVIMGRLTWDSIGRKPLPGRTNIIVSASGRAELGEPPAIFLPSLEEAIRIASDNVWLIGGARIYEAGLAFADVIDLTYVPEIVPHYGASWHAPGETCNECGGPGDHHVVRFPEIDESVFEPGPILPHEDEPALTRQVFTRRR